MLNKTLLSQVWDYLRGTWSLVQGNGNFNHKYIQHLISRLCFDRAQYVIKTLLKHTTAIETDASVLGSVPQLNFCLCKYSTHSRLVLIFLAGLVISHSVAVQLGEVSLLLDYSYMGRTNRSHICCRCTHHRLWEGLSSAGGHISNMRRTIITWRAYL